MQREKAEQALDDPEDLRGPIHLPVLRQGKSPYKRGFDEGDVNPQTKKKKIDLIFKDVLEASLESAKAEAHQLALSTSLVIRKVPKYQGDAYGRCAMTMSHGVQNISRTQGEGDWKPPPGAASTEPGPLEDEEEEPSSFKADSPAEASLASDLHELPTTSFCPNCIRLKKKVRELQAELDMLKSGKLPEPPVLPAQVLELPEFSDPAGKSVWMRCCQTEEQTAGHVRVAGHSLLGPPLGEPEACDSEVRSGHSPRPQVPASDLQLRWVLPVLPCILLVNKGHSAAEGVCAVFLTCCLSLGVLVVSDPKVQLPKPLFLPGPKQAVLSGRAPGLPELIRVLSLLLPCPTRCSTTGSHVPAWGLRGTCVPGIQLHASDCFCGCLDVLELVDNEEDLSVHVCSRLRVFM